MRWSTVRPWDLALALAALLLLDTLVAAGVAGILRVAVGVVAVLVAPGYLVVAALFPARHRVVEVRAGEAGEGETRRSEEGLGGLERVALSVGLSVAVVPLVGLLLHFSPWGVGLASTLAGLTVLSVATAALAWWRRARLHPDERPRLEVTLRAPDWGSYAPVDKALTAALALAVLAALGALAWALAAPHQPEPFTQFYVLAPDGAAEGYPTNATAGQPVRVRLGVANHEGEAVAYVLRVVAERGRIVNASGGDAFVPEGEEVLARRDVSLEAGARWEEEVSFRLDAPGTHRVRFELEKPGSPAPHRSLHLLLDVRA